MVNYSSEIKRFISSQYIFSGIRIALAIVIPSAILAYFGILKDYFLFPLATSFVGLSDQVGPFVRRRNSLILAIFCFICVAVTASFLKDFPILIYLEIIVFGLFFSMIGVYGQRLATVGGLSLVVFSIFIDGNFLQHEIWKDILIFAAGCIWFLIIFLFVSKIQPYRLASQLIGENYIELSEYLKIKAKFYHHKEDLDHLTTQIISKQIVIKNLQEETRELVFKTRTIVNESTTTSRILMLMFLNSIDLYEKIFTSEQDYKKLREKFTEERILEDIHDFLIIISEEISNVGISLQRGLKSSPIHNINEELQKVFDEYFDCRSRKMSENNFEDFMALRLVLLRMKELSGEIKKIYHLFSQDQKLAKSLSTGLDYEKFLPKQEKLNSKVFISNFSLKSLHFRHAIRITLAMLLGYGISQFQSLGIGHSYWILITIVAIMRPAYSTTKHRNLLRLYGTVSGAIVAYFLLIFVQNSTVLLVVLFSTMILCFALLKGKYSWAVFFMTIYIFIVFNFLNPGNVNTIFKDRILDTLIAGLLVFLISYFVLPVWEHSQNLDLMKKSLQDNIKYFSTAINKLSSKSFDALQYKLIRKNAIISLANLSDNFQRMISDPKNQREKLEKVHQFVNTSHLITAYTASLSQYSDSEENFEEIDFENWKEKINSKLTATLNLLENQSQISSENHEKENPKDLVDELLLQRKTEIHEKEFFDLRDPNRISHLTKLKNIRELLSLLNDVAEEQYKVMKNYYEKN